MPANFDPAEVSKFDALAAHWWDKQGPMGPLHAINPLRLNFIERHTDISGMQALDVGCGGGILTEAMARNGALARGLDMAEDALAAAQRHAQDAGVKVDYHCGSVEALAEQEAGHYDIITCMEMLEHVPDPQSIVQACATLLKPGGHMFLSTINRNPKSFAFAIVGAEHVLGLIPKGTHEYAKFIQPAELAAWCRAAGLNVGQMQGMSYNPLTRTHKLSRDVDVNYLMHCTKPC